MKQTNFTAKFLLGLQCGLGKQQSIYWDGKTPGLGLRVTAAGAKSFIFETRLHNKTIRLTIGNIRTWPVGKAQDEATRLKTLTDQGIDPRQQAAEQRADFEAAQAAARSKIALVADAWAMYLGHQRNKMQRLHIERGKRWGARHLADHENLAQAGGKKKIRGSGLTKPGVLYPLLRMRLADITSEVLKDWQRKEAEIRANNARQGFEMFRAFWRWCGSCNEYSSVIDIQAVESRDLRDEVPSRKSKKFDVLQRGYLPAWFAAVRHLHNPIMSAYLQALLLTGARRAEMAELRWQNISFQWSSIQLKDKIAEEGRQIPLTPYLSSLLVNLPRHNEWVFSSPASASGRIAEPRIPHNRALSVAGVPQMSLHGLRRTFASLAEWIEMPRGVVAQIMGHAPSATAEKHYIDRPLELLAVWHSRYEAWILEQAGIEFVSVQGGLRAIA